MLVQASRDGRLEVVLRLLYTNPFINRQELRDALWEAVRCRRLEVLRSLLEFRVDPASAPSPGLSQPPAQLRKVQWTPLLALAVNGSSDRAEIVAELLSRDCREDSKPRLQGQQRAIAAGTADGGEAGTAPAARAAPNAGASPQPAAHKRMALPGTLASGAAGIHGSGVGRPRCKLEEPPRRSDLLTGLIADATAADRERRLDSLPSEDLAAAEAELEALLRMVRCNRQKRWEQQLQSVQRRHAEVSRGRQELEEEQSCVVCSELEKTMLFMPCRHLCTCEACAAQLSVCPICRAQIEDKVRCIRP